MKMCSLLVVGIWLSRYAERRTLLVHDCVVCACLRLAEFSLANDLAKQGDVALSHLACILMPLHSFVPQLPSPSCCVRCQLDKFSFFFLPSSRTSAGLCQLRYHRCRCLPLRAHRPYPVVAATNPHYCHVNTAATSPIP